MLTTMTENQVNRMYIRNIPIHWSGSNSARWVTRKCQYKCSTNTCGNPRTDRDQDMANGFIIWHCTTSEFKRFLLAYSNHLLVTSRSDLPTIAKRADNRPGPKQQQWSGYEQHQFGVTGYDQRQSGVTSSTAAGSATASGSASLVKQGGAKKKAPNVSRLYSRFEVIVLKKIGAILCVS